MREVAPARDRQLGARIAAPQVWSHPLGGIELSIVVPAFNEDGSIAACVRSHGQVARELTPRFEILVLDDGSEDATSTVLEGLRSEHPELRILRHGSNEGIGHSLLDLYRAARGTWIFFNAADGQVPADELRKLWLARGGHSLVVGRRSPRRDPPARIVISTLYSLAVRALFRIGVHDVDSVKLYLASALRRAWPTTESSFAEAEILIRLHELGHEVAEVPIRHLPRSAGRAKGASPGIVVRALFDFAVFVLRHRVRTWLARRDSY